MSKFVTTVLAVACVGSSFWFYPMLPEQIPSSFAEFGEPGNYSPKLSVILSLVASVLVVYVAMLTTSRIVALKYKRFQKSINLIFMLVILVLSAVYAGTIVNGLGYELNMLLFAPLGTGFALIVTGNEVQRFKADANKGTPLFEAYSDFWNKIRRFFARGLFAGGLLMLPCVFFPVTTMFVSFLIVLGLMVATLLLGSWIIYRKHYNNRSDKTI